LPGRCGGQITRQAKREKGRYGPSAHGRQVAESPRQRAMAHSLRLVPIESKVTAFDGEIGRHGQFLARAQAEQRTVVPNAQSHCSGGWHCSPATNPAEQSQFSRRVNPCGFTAFCPHASRIVQTTVRRVRISGKPSETWSFLQFRRVFQGEFIDPPRPRLLA
jgi:hypothetical protein